MIIACIVLFFLANDESERNYRQILMMSCFTNYSISLSDSSNRKGLIAYYNSPVFDENVLSSYGTYIFVNTCSFFLCFLEYLSHCRFG